MSKANILVVDDQDSIRHFVSRALEDEGYAVHVTGSVREAREAIAQDLPDVAILDLKLPDGNGLELLREIKRLQPEVTVILMTAFGELETAVEAMSAGAFWFVKKPFQNEELLALANRALSPRRCGSSCAGCATARSPMRTSCTR
jgi:DNA-binding NtrC family response regulator